MSIEDIYILTPRPPMKNNIKSIGYSSNLLNPKKWMKLRINEIVIRFFELVWSLINPEGIIVIILVSVAVAKRVPICNPLSPILLKCKAKKNVIPIVNDFVMEWNSEIFIIGFLSIL